MRDSPLPLPGSVLHLLEISSNRSETSNSEDRRNGTALVVEAFHSG